MAGRRILSDAQIDQMAEMREAGQTLEAIARHFTAAGTPIKSATIAWQCLRVGAYPPNYTLATLGRGEGGRGRPFTPDEDAQLLALEAQALSYTEIGKRLGRPHNSIRARLYTLARRDTIREDEAARPRPTPAKRRSEALIKHRRKRQLASTRAKLDRLERECQHVQ